MHDEKLRINPSCSAEMPEMAFIIDSSGSMKKNDPGQVTGVENAGIAKDFASSA